MSTLADDMPLTPLDFFREEMEFNPWTFYGCQTSNNVSFEQVIESRTVPSPANPFVQEFSWQAEAKGRSDIRNALYRAEQLLETFLHYSIAPRFREDTLSWPPLADSNMIRWRPVGANGKWLNMQLPVGYVVQAGVEARTLVSAGVAVTYSDADSDGVKEIATLTFAYTGDISQLALYFVSGDRYGIDTDISERWRVQPIKASVTGGVATVRIPSWLLVRPILYPVVNPTPIVIDTPMTSFAQTLDVYRRYVDPTGTTVDTAQAVVVWETSPCHGWWCCCGCQNPSFTNNIYDPAATAQATARVALTDARLGHVAPIESVYDATTGEWSAVVPWGWDGCPCSEPNRVKVRTLAGYPLTSSGMMDPQWRKLVCILAAAELGGGLSGAKESNRLLYYWQQDLAKTGNDRDLYATSNKVLNNPFGTRRGHVHVWNQVDDGGKAQTRSILVP